MKLDLRHNRPDVEILPDGRKRARFVYEARQWAGRTLAEITASLTVARGSTGPGDFSGLRLITQEIQGSEQNVKAGAIPVIRVYEEIPATGEVQVGGNTRIKLEDGRDAIEAEFLQMSSDTYVPGTVGTTTAPGDASAFLQQATATDNGTVRSIKRTYVYAGTLSQVDETKNDGKLLIRSIVAVKTAPSTPTGYTLVTANVKNPNGIPVYSYTFAKGSGRVSTDIAYKQNGKLKITTIRYLNTDDGATPDGILINDDFDRRDGFTLYTKGYAEVVDDGIVSSEVETKYKGKLKIYRIVRLGSAPEEPDPTIGGTVTLVSAETRQEDFFTLYDYRWAEGYGRISLETETRNGGKLTLSTVRYFDTDDGVAPSGTVINTTVTNEDGVDLTTKVYAAGEGEISRESESRFNGMLQRVTIRHLTSTATSTQPTADPLSGGTLVSEGRNDQDGYRLWTVLWTKASGTSLVSDEVDLRNRGKLIIYRRSRFNAAPDAPSATIDGTVVAVSSGSRLQDGWTLYDAVWAEGKGVIAKRTQPRDGGIRLETWESLGDEYDDTFMKPPGTLLARDHDDIDGATRWTVTCVQKSDGSDLNFNIGTITAINVTNEGNSYTEAPTVTIDAPPEGGVQATAVAHLGDGGEVGPNAVWYIEITNAGRGYTTAPGVSFSGGGGGSGAAATAVIDGAPQTALTFEEYVRFEYPGRAKYFSQTIGSGACKDVYLSPPVATQVLATVEILYLSTDKLNLAHPIWNPKDWATLNAKWVSWGNYPRAKVEGLRGYRAVNSGASGTSGGTGWDTTIFGDRVFASSDWSIALSGGPPDPGGSTWTLEARAEPAFVAYDGTQYFRHTIVHAAIPEQEALPV